MSTAELTQDDLAEVAENRRVHYFRTLLKDFEREASTKVEPLAEFREWLDQLSDVVVTRSYQRHYNPTYLNLLSVFGEELPHQDVHSLAIKCIKTKLWDECEYYFHLSQLLELVKSCQNGKTAATDQSLIRLKGWDSGLIRSLLKGGRGLVICSFRFGAIRYIPIELALLGFPIVEAVNKPTHEVMESAFDSLGKYDHDVVVPAEERPPHPENIRLLKAVNAEDERCAVELVNALKRNEIIGLCVEGNTGSDGPWGDTSKSTVNFLGHTISAKNGAARLAAALRAPILPVVALSEGEHGRLLFSEPIIPPSGLKRSANEEFVQATMQSLYTLLDDYVRRYPEQWEGWSALHRWRLHEAEAAASDRASRDLSPQEIAALLREGKRFRVNKRRVAQLPTKEGLMWVDLKTLKGFQNPKWAGQENILATLSEPQGLDLTWINKDNSAPDWEEKICLLLAYLQESGLVASN